MSTRTSVFIIAITLLGCKEKEQAITIEKLGPIEYSMDHNANLILENPEINSVSIGIYKDGKTYTKYYGEIDKGKGNPPNDNSLFEIASVTKTFTGIITAQAVLDGKLNLDDDIRKYLNGAYPNLEYENRPIQIRDLVTHTSGITRDFSKTLTKMFSQDASENDKKAISEYTKEALFVDLKNFKLDTIPGARCEYSPIVAPEILAIILENVFQKPYSVLLNQLIFEEAQMKHTATRIKPGDEKYRVNGYSDEGTQVMPIPVPMNGAGGGLKSTIPDIVNYIQFLIESKNPVIEEMKKPLFFDKEEGDQYGYFWQLGADEFMHSGGTNGSTNWVIVLPEFNSGFTVMFNSNGKTSGRLINNLANRIYDDIENYPKKNAYFNTRKAMLENTDKGITYFHKLKKDSLADFDFKDESMLNRIGYELLRQDKILEAIKVFQLLVTEFPDSSNPYDSLGEAYFINEHYDLALVNYEKSIALNPENGNAKKMIDQIEQINKNP